MLGCLVNITNFESLAKLRYLSTLNRHLPFPLDKLKNILDCSPALLD
jgi:hypothetical protein